MSLQMEIPGALAGAAGVGTFEGTVRPENYRKSPRNAISAYALDRHKRAAKMLGFALVGSTPDLWHGCGAVWAVRLTTSELVSIAFIALRQLDPETRELAFHAAHWGELG